MYKNNNGNHDGRNYINWYNKRGSTNQKLDNIPHVTTIVNGSKRYYSNLDGELYFGDIFVDEITNIAINIQQQTMPLFGYNSYTFDDVAVGSRLVQGQFSVNFTKRNFLTSLQNSQSFKKICRRSYGKDEEETTVYSDFRQRLHLPKWDKGFDIVIGLGGNNNGTQDSLYNTFLVIGCVQVNSYSIQLDMSGKPLIETYTFIGREIKDSLSDSIEANPTSAASTYKSTNENDSLGSVINKGISITGSIDLTAKSKHLVISSKEVVTFNTGTIQFIDSFENKILSSQLTINPDDNNNILVCTLSNNFISAFKKECIQNESIIGHVVYKYKRSIDNNLIEESANIPIAIKKL